MSFLKSGLARFLLAFGMGGAIVGFGLVAVLLRAGPETLCAKALLCSPISVEQVGGAKAIHLAGAPDLKRGFSVYWETANPLQDARVSYRPDGLGGWREAKAVSVPAPPNGFLKGAGHIHRTTIEGLEPGTVYEYRVSSDLRGAGPWSETFRTRTLPETGPVSLAFVSDLCLRDRPDGRSAGVEVTRASLSQARPDYILGGGDYACALDDGRYAMAEPAIQQWFQEWQSVFTRSPFLAQYGNLECCHGSDTSQWKPRLTQGWAGSYSPDGLSFSFDVLDAHFVGFFEPGTGAVPGKDALDWLEADLEAARARGQRFLVVYQHGPLFGAGQTHPPDPSLQAAIVPILERQQVDLHLSGHDQSYERTLPLMGGADGKPKIGSQERGLYDRWDGVVYAKVSPSGRHARLQPNLPETIPAYMAVADDSAYYYAMISLSGQGELSVVTHKVDANANNDVIDTFKITR